MDIATISGAYEGLKLGKELLRSVYNSKVEADAKEKIDQVLHQLGEAQDALFSMREELFRLQEENQNLRKAADSEERWADKFASYALAQTSGGAIVYQYSGEPAHYACPACIEKRTIQILQDNRTASGKFRCVSCSAEYPINQSQRVNFKPPRSSGPKWP